MWNTKQIFNQVRKKSSELLYGVPKKVTRKPRVVVNKPDTKLETTHRRHGRWGSLRKARSDSWNAVEVSRRMERVLRPATREEETERLRQKEVRNGERAARLVRLYNNEDFKFFLSILKNWEVGLFIDLSKPELRKEGVSQEYYYGFINGGLGNLSDIKEIFVRAFARVKKGDTTK